MLISNNFSSLNSNKASNYNRNMSLKKNLNNNSHKKSATQNPSFTGVGTILGLIGFGATVLGGLIYINDKTNIIPSMEDSIHREAGNKRRKANFSKSELIELRRRAKHIKQIHNDKMAVSKAVKNAAKLATA